MNNIVFDNETFRTDLFYAITKLVFYIMYCEQFESVFIATLNIRVPLKKSSVGAKKVPSRI